MKPVLALLAAIVVVAIDVILALALLRYDD
jgi:hypothetical protein